MPQRTAVASPDSLDSLLSEAESVLAEDIPPGEEPPEDKQPADAEPDEEPTVESSEIRLPDRKVRVGAFPISIDSSALDAQARTRETLARAASLRTELASPRILMLGVDRLDYTKGILVRLEAFEALLESGALDPSESVLVQVATPSRERVDDYRRTRARVEHAVGRINGRFGSLGRPVIHYIHRPVPFEHLLGLYAAADVMLITALLVAAYTA